VPPVISSRRLVLSAEGAIKLIVPLVAVVFAEVIKVGVAVSCDTVILPVVLLYTAELVSALTVPPEMVTVPAP